MFGEIGERVQSAARVRVRDHRLGELTPIEGVAVRRGDALERSCHRRAAPHLAGDRRAPSGQEVLGEAEVVRQHLLGRGPFLRDDRRHRIAVPRIPYGRQRRGRRKARFRSVATARPTPRRRRESSPPPSRAGESPPGRRTAAGVAAAGARPEALSPISSRPSQRIANRSLPMPLLHGSTTVRAMAAASAASTAFPPRWSIAMPACTASGCDVATALRASTGWRREG